MCGSHIRLGYIIINTAQEGPSPPASQDQQQQPQQEHEHQQHEAAAPVLCSSVGVPEEPELLQQDVALDVSVQGPSDACAASDDDKAKGRMQTVDRDGSASSGEEASLGKGQQDEPLSISSFSPLTFISQSPSAPCAPAPIMIFEVGYRETRLHLVRLDAGVVQIMEEPTVMAAPFNMSWYLDQLELQGRHAALAKLEERGVLVGREAWFVINVWWGRSGVYSCASDVDVDKRFIPMYMLSKCTSHPCPCLGVNLGVRPSS